MSSERLKGARFEERQKAVDYAPNFKDRTELVALNEALEDDLNEVIDCIGAGRLLPPRFYRNGIDRDSDPLLEQDGIKHLHLGGSDSDILLFLVEYEERVVLLEINSHKHFSTDPPGSLLRSLHETYLRGKDKEASGARAARVQKNKGIVRTGLLPKKR